MWLALDKEVHALNIVHCHDGPSLPPGAPRAARTDTTSRHMPLLRRIGAELVVKRLATFARPLALAGRFADDDTTTTRNALEGGFEATGSVVLLEVCAPCGTSSRSAQLISTAFTSTSLSVVLGMFATHRRNAQQLLAMPSSADPRKSRCDTRPRPAAGMCRWVWRHGGASQSKGNITKVEKKKSF